MSPDAIKNTLLPFLDTLTKKEDDEVVFAIAEELANIAYNFYIKKTVIKQSTSFSFAVLIKLMCSWWNCGSRKGSKIDYKVIRYV